LIVQHDRDGAFGLVLTRPLDKTVGDIWELVSEESSDCNLPINLGGPVAGPLVALHSDEQRAEDEVVSGVYFTARKELLGALVADPPSDLRVFSGYSGWAGGQLEGELEAGGWLVVPASAEDVFGEIEQVWRRISRRINLDILGESQDLKHVPDDPSWN